MQAFLNAIVSWLLLKASEYDVASALRWLSGSLNGVKDVYKRQYKFSSKKSR